MPPALRLIGWLTRLPVPLAVQLEPAVAVQVQATPVIAAGKVSLTRLFAEVRRPDVDDEDGVELDPAVGVGAGRLVVDRDRQVADLDSTVVEALPLLLPGLVSGVLEETLAE